jgi:hypothetical protein
MGGELMNKIEEIVDFVTKHPQTIAGRRICREVLGEAIERFNEEFSTEFLTRLEEKDEARVDSYYSLIK